MKFVTVMILSMVLYDLSVLCLEGEFQDHVLVDQSPIRAVLVVYDMSLWKNGRT